MNEGIRILVSVNDRNRLQSSGFKCEKYLVSTDLNDLQFFKNLWLVNFKLK